MSFGCTKCDLVRFCTKEERYPLETRYIRRVKEALHIILHPNNINRDNGIEISEAWTSTITKHRRESKRLKLRDLQLKWLHRETNDSHFYYLPFVFRQSSSLVKSHVKKLLNKDINLCLPYSAGRPFFDLLVLLFHLWHLISGLNGFGVDSGLLKAVFPNSPLSRTETFFSWILLLFNHLFTIVYLEIEFWSSYELQ